LRALFRFPGISVRRPLQAVRLEQSIKPVLPFLAALQG